MGIGSYEHGRGELFSQKRKVEMEKEIGEI
jgi:hypothetical protein